MFEIINDKNFRVKHLFSSFISITFSTRVRRNRSLIAIPGLVQKNISCYIITLFFIFIAIPFSINAQNKITIQFENRVGEKLLQTDSVYTNASGESFTVRNFKYYISNIVLEGGNKTQSFS